MFRITLPARYWTDFEKKIKIPIFKRSSHFNDFVHDSKMMIYANLSEMMINGGLSYLFREYRQRVPLGVLFRYPIFYGVFVKNPPFQEVTFALFTGLHQKRMYTNLGSSCPQCVHTIL